jgi:hypothetical protein
MEARKSFSQEDSGDRHAPAEGSLPSVHQRAFAPHGLRRPVAGITLQVLPRSYYRTGPEFVALSRQPLPVHCTFLPYAVRFSSSSIRSRLAKALSSSSASVSTRFLGLTSKLIACLMV